MYKSSWDIVGKGDDPDLVYYNASIVNNTTADTIRGQAYPDPPIRFNETRDTPVIKDASKYQFSIIRFSVNGGNKDLPLFIPAIQSGTGQTDINLTEYSVALSWNGLGGATDFPSVSIMPTSTYVEYRPETLNPILAPLPRPPCAPSFVGAFDITRQYNKGEIVLYQSLYYQADKLVPANAGPPNTASYPIPNSNPPRTALYWKGVSDELGSPQDLSSRYYWVYTYEHWVDLVNETLETANHKLWDLYTSNTTPGLVPYALYSDWTAVNPTPRLWYDRASGLFSVYFPESYLPPAEGSNAPQLMIWFNTNMEGLFSNFNNEYWNNSTNYPGLPYSPLSQVGTPPGYANRILVQVEGIGNNIKKETKLDGTDGTTWIQMTQDYASTSTLWSPIESIVFTSTLLPIFNEQTAPPNRLGAGNIGNSSSTSTSAFTPIITDVALDLSTSGSSDYRKMIYYSPSAEYRMTDFQNAKTEIKNIDVQVYWKNRLDNQLYPVTMFNLSSVSIKIMFRRKIVA
jgi:hypothetical protein